jgi:hypothetical protein
MPVGRRSGLRQVPPLRAAGEIIHVPGFYLGDPIQGPLGEQAYKVGGAIATELGLDATDVIIHVVDSQELARLHRRIGGRKGATFELEGFHLDGHAFLRRSLGFVKDSTFVHEVLHALSEKFSAEAHRRGYRNLVEGITEYFTRKVIVNQFQITPQTSRRSFKTYVDYTSFAEAIAHVVGTERLRMSFFGQGYVSLERAVDARLGTRTFERASWFLEKGDLAGALSVLGIR